MKRRFKKRQLPDWIGAPYDPKPNSQERRETSCKALSNCDVGQGSSSSETRQCNEADTAATDVKGFNCSGERRNITESKQHDRSEAHSGREAAAPDNAEAAGTELEPPPSQPASGTPCCVKETCGTDGPREDSDELFANQGGQNSTAEHCGKVIGSRCNDSGEAKKKKKRKLFGPVKPKTEAVLSFEKAVSDALPFLKFEGEVVYTYSAGECSAICERFLSSLTAESKMYVGFDLEWTVTFQTGSSEKVSLVQVCLSEKLCYLFHICAMQTVPRALWQVLSDQRVVKVGLNIEPDMWKLERDYDDFKAKPVIERCVVELSRLANQKLKSSERWSLDDLSRHVLRHRLKKDEGVRYEAWHRYPLCDQQIAYATADAFACLKIYQSLA